MIYLLSGSWLPKFYPPSTSQTAVWRKLWIKLFLVVQCLNGYTLEDDSIQKPSNCITCYNRVLFKRKFPPNLHVWNQYLYVIFLNRSLYNHSTWSMLLVTGRINRNVQQSTSSDDLHAGLLLFSCRQRLEAGESWCSLPTLPTTWYR